MNLNIKTIGIKGLGALAFGLVFFLLESTAYAQPIRAVGWHWNGGRPLHCVPVRGYANVRCAAVPVATYYRAVGYRGPGMYGGRYYRHYDEFHRGYGYRHNRHDGRHYHDHGHHHDHRDGGHHHR